MSSMLRLDVLVGISTSKCL